MDSTINDHYMSPRMPTSSFTAGSLLRSVYIALGDVLVTAMTHVVHRYCCIDSQIKFRDMTFVIVVCPYTYVWAYIAASSADHDSILCYNRPADSVPWSMVCVSSEFVPYLQISFNCGKQYTRSTVAFVQYKPSLPCPDDAR